MIKLNKSGAGFTLVETLIAVTIIVVGLVGAVSLITYAISTLSFVRGKLLASQFAQEGIEMVRNMRDNNWLAGKIATGNWHDGLGSEIPTLYVPALLEKPGEIPTPAGDWKLAPSIGVNDNNSIVYFNNDNKFYGQSESGTGFALGSWTRAPFNLKRWIQLYYDSDKDRVEITSYVQWQEKGRTHNFEIKDYLYNWQVGGEVCPPGYTLCSACGQPSGTSYYEGGIDPITGFDIKDGPCTGQEMVWLNVNESPFRSSPQNVCIGAAVSQPYTYCSKRSSSAICEPIDCVTLPEGQAKLIVDPF